MFRLGEKFFVEGPPPPPPSVKGKIFDTRFGLIHVQTGEKNFVEGPPPPPEYQGLAMATRRAVCLLRSRRRTFLLQLKLLLNLIYIIICVLPSPFTSEKIGRTRCREETS